MENEIIEARIGKYLTERGLKLSVAESCTGGLIGHRITNIPGSSNYYLGSITAYAYEAKVRLLGVKWSTLEKFGAVSEETVLEMATGIKNVFDADIGLAVSGIAGPGGGMPHKPVGYTWIGLSSENFVKAWNFTWKGNRIENKEQTAQKALELLEEYLVSL